MKKAAPKISRSKIFRPKKSSEKVKIPPDILKDKISNETPVKSSDDVAETSESLGLSEEEKIINKEDPIEEVPQQIPSFYEKVTGEKPPVTTDGNVTSGDNASSDELPQIEKLNKKLFFLGGFVFLLTIIVTTIIGIFIFNSSSEPQTKVVEEIKVEASPTPVPTVELNKSEWTFEVLNGSGEAGKAKKTADAITDLGYTVEDTGNASENDYIGVTVSFIDEIETEVKDLILADLKKAFQSVKEDDLKEESEAAILLIVGK